MVSAMAKTEKKTLQSKNKLTSFFFVIAAVAVVSMFIIIAAELFVFWK